MEWSVFTTRLFSFARGGFLAAIVVVTTTSPALAQTAPAQPPAGPPPVTTPAFVVQSDNGDNRLQLGGFVQTDGRAVLGDSQDRVTNSFVMRRFRLLLQGRLARHFEYFWNVDFAGGVINNRDMYFDTVFSRAFRVRVGKMRPLFSYDRSLLVATIPMIERGMSTNVAPDRDTGLQLLGDLAGNVISYSAFLGNGTVDGGSSESDTNESKDLVGRLLVRPWARQPNGALAPLTVGMAGSTGIQPTALPSFPSPARQIFFSYAAGAAGEGRRTRWSPQAYYYSGPFGGFGEFVRSRGAIRRGDTTGEVDHDSWQIVGTWVLTGEAAGERNVRPRVNFDPPSGHWGALQVAARYQALHVSREAFTLGLAAPGASRTADTWAVGLNWYLNPLIKWQINYERTEFDGDSRGPRPAENALLVRAHFGL